jgi:membrane peptidoglycan carboxypeptidase
VRLPTGTAHALAAHGFPIAVMAKTGTTNEFKDAIFVGSTYGPERITAAVRIGFDDNHSLGSRETGGKLALPVFQEVMLGVYRDQMVGPAPAFPVLMEERITASQLLPQSPLTTDAGRNAAAGESSTRRLRSSPTKTEWLLQHGRTVHTPIFHAAHDAQVGAAGCEPLGRRCQAQRRNLRSLARRSLRCIANVSEGIAADQREASRLGSADSERTEAYSGRTSSVQFETAHGQLSRLPWCFPAPRHFICCSESPFIRRRGANRR